MQSPPSTMNRLDGEGARDTNQRVTELSGRIAIRWLAGVLGGLHIFELVYFLSAGYGPARHLADGLHFELGDLPMQVHVMYFCPRCRCQCFRPSTLRQVKDSILRLLGVHPQ